MRDVAVADSTSRPLPSKASSSIESLHLYCNVLPLWLPDVEVKNALHQNSEEMWLRYGVAANHGIAMALPLLTKLPAPAALSTRSLAISRPGVWFGTRVLTMTSPSSPSQ